MIPSYSTACIDWETRLINRQSIIPPPIFPDEAASALRIFKNLRIPDLAGKPTFGESSEKWVFDYVAAIFGAYDRSTGDQLIQESLLLVSKKNGKSGLAAAIMLTALILCWREEEEHLIFAPTREVADASYNAAAGMVRADSELQTMFNVRDHIKTIEHRSKKNTLKVVSADTKTATGKKAGRILIDEIHEFGTMAKAETVFTEATGGLVARPEGFVIMLTTQSAEPPAGVFKERLDYYRRVRDGEVIDPRSLPVLYEFPQHYIENKLYLNPENFYITNPNLGRSVSQQWLVDRLKRSQAGDSGKLQNFISKHLNVEIGLNLRSDRWAGADFWESAADRGGAYGLADLVARSEVVSIGIDGGGLDDLLGLYVMGRETGTGRKLGWGFAWAHPSVLERRQEIAPRLKDFAKAGELCLVDELGQDVQEMAKIVEIVYNSGKLDKIGVDQMALGSIEEELEALGIDAQKWIVTISQGWRLGASIKTAERWLADKSFIPAKQELMAWSVGNAKIEQRANSILITKQASGTAKIDPLIALLNAATLMALNPESKGSLNLFLSDPIIV